MIDYIRGEIAELTPAAAVIDCSGMGYELNITLQDYASLQGQSEAKLYVSESIRDDAHILYGFTTRRARELFTLLTGVSGVGPATGRLILSSLSVGELEMTIAGGNSSALKAVKGIGAKTAERIIIDLRDKIKPGESPLSTQPTPANEAFDEALAALVMLGFNQAAARKALLKLFGQEPMLSVEEAVRKALKIL